MSHLGFTGTADGMTLAQALTVGRLLLFMRPDFVHHGDCVGADAKFHGIAYRHSIGIHIHPPTDEKLRAFCGGVAGRGSCLHPAAPYLVRNHHIVDWSDALIATPYESSEVLRSGTWATVRYARKKGIPVFVALPSGGIESSGLPDVPGAMV
jgi:hypothetical protein